MRELNFSSLSFGGLDAQLEEELDLDEQDDAYLSSLDPRIHERLVAPEYESSDGTKYHHPFDNMDGRK